jgi:hypothetical protein
MTRNYIVEVLGTGGAIPVDLPEFAEQLLRIKRLKLRPFQVRNVQHE